MHPLTLLLPASPLPCVPLLGAQPGIPRRDGQCVEACRRVGEELARCLQGACVERTRGGGASAWDRVFSPPDFCTQALTLLEYLLRNGSERSVEDARDHVYQLRTMCDFQYVEAGGVDQGINGAHAASRAMAAPATASEPATAEARTCEADASAARRAVREKSRQISDLLNDRDRLKEEREKARQNRGKYGGVSAGKMQGFGSEGGFGNSGKKYGGFSSEDARRGHGGGGGGGSGAVGGRGDSWYAGSGERGQHGSHASRPSAPAAADRLRGGRIAGPQAR